MDGLAPSSSFSSKHPIFHNLNDLFLIGPEEQKVESTLEALKHTHTSEGRRPTQTHSLHPIYNLQYFYKNLMLRQKQKQAYLHNEPQVCYI